MATIIDALVVTLGLNSKGFTDGAKKVRQAFKSTSEESDKMAKNMDVRGKQAAASLGAIRNQALALLAVFTAGMGIKTFAANTINSAAGLGQMSKNLTMSTRDLVAWQRAAARAGGSAESITAQMKESSSEIAKARMGQGSDTAAWFYRMGGQDIRTFKDGNEYLMARAKIVAQIYKTDPSRAAVVAANMGISEENFNLIKQGPEAIKALVEAQRKNATITAKEAALALELRNKYLDLGDSFQSIGTRVMIALIPALGRALDYFQRMADWTRDHRADIAKWVDGAVDAVVKFAEWADKAAQSVGGWKNVLIALAAIKILGMISPLFSLAAALTAVGKALGLVAVGKGAVGVLAGAAGVAAVAGVAAATYSRNLNEGEQGTLDAMRGAPTGAAQGEAARAVKAFMGMGWTQEQAIGIVANLQAESGLDHTAVGDNGRAYGVAQWHPDRQALFQKAFGFDIRKATKYQQYQFVDLELRTNERKAGEALRNATNNQVAAEIVKRLYERPAGGAEETARRQGLAAALFGAINKQGLPNTGALSAVHTAGVLDIRAGSTTSNTSTSETNINGPITINTQATDAQGIARDLWDQVKMLTPQANTGLR